MQTPLTVIILTGENDICLPLIKRVADDPRINVAGIIYDKKKSHPKRSVLQLIRRHLYYSGPLETLLYIIRRLFPGSSRNGKVVQPSSLGKIHAFTEEEKIPFVAVDDINTENAAHQIKTFNADLGVVIGTSILKPNILNSTSRGMINVHQGKIPEYRGGDTVFWSLFNDEKELGVVIHQVIEAVDAGKILLEELIPLKYDYTKYGDKFEVYLDEIKEVLDRLSVRLVYDAMIQIAEGTDMQRTVDIVMGKRHRKASFRNKQELRERLRQRFGQPRN